MKPHRILHILDTAQPEGSSFVSIVKALSAGLSPEKYTLQAWFLGKDGPLVGDLEQSGVRTRVLNWLDGARDPIGAFRFWKAMRGQDFSIAHMHIGGRSVRWLVRVRTPAKMVMHLHGRVHEGRGFTLVSHHVADFDRAIATSQAVAQRAVGPKPVVVYPGVSIPDPPEFQSAPERLASPALIGTAGRLVPFKGIVYLVRALPLLLTKFPDLQLEILGSGPEQAALEVEVRKLGLETSVSFLGWRTEVTRIISRWNCYVQPSLEEGFGIAALEAMAAGIPVVASDVGGLPELVEDNVTGFLVPPHNPRELAERIGRLLSDRNRRREMGEAARSRARDRFSVGRMVAEIAGVYDELLA